MRIGAKIRNRRVALDLSQRDLAAQLMIDVALVCRYENGQLPSINKIPEIAEFLGVSTNDLLKDRNEEDLQNQLSKISGRPVLSTSEIERRAVQDRTHFLSYIGREETSYPHDRDAIPRCFGLDVAYRWVLTREGSMGIGNSSIYAGLFVGDTTYEQMENVIVVATQTIGARDFQEVSERTQTFHVLHELGHYRLHYQAGHGTCVTAEPNKPMYCSSSSRGGNRSDTERQANAYASAFLMPRDEIVTALGGRRSIDLRRDSKSLCELFFVEPWTLKFRLNRLGIQVYEQ